MTDDNDTIVFGVLKVDEKDATVFLRRSEAETLAQAYAAAQDSQTWGEFRQSCPSQMLEEIEEILEEEGELYDDDEPFDGLEDIPGYADGIWPGFPERDQMEWLPNDIQKRYGETIETLHDGSMLQFSVEHQEEVIRGVIAHGFQCSRDDALVRKACGY